MKTKLLLLIALLCAQSWGQVATGHPGVGGGTASGTVTGTGTTNTVPLWSNGPTGVLGDSLFSDISGIGAYGGTEFDVLGGVIKGQSLAAAGTTAGLVYMTQGTAASCPTTSVCLTAPSSVTAYKVVYPAAAGSGIPRWANSANTITASVSELSGDATTSGSNAVTVVNVNGVAYGSSPATDTVPVITASNTETYKAMPDCTDTGGNHVNYTASTHAFSCGTSGGSSGVGTLYGSIFSNTVALSSTNYYAVTGTLATISATEAPRQIVVPVTTTCQNLFVTTTSTQNAGGTLVITLRDNAADTAVVATVTAGGTAGVYSDTTHTVSITQGHAIDYKIVNNYSGGVSASMSNFALQCK